MCDFSSFTACKEEFITDGEATSTVGSLCTSLATLYKLFPVTFITAFGSGKYSNYLRGKRGGPSSRKMSTFTALV